jgi:hypothetical protein
VAEHLASKREGAEGEREGREGGREGRKPLLLSTQKYTKQSKSQEEVLGSRCLVGDSKKRHRVTWTPVSSTSSSYCANPTLALTNRRVSCHPVTFLPLQHVAQRCTKEIQREEGQTPLPCGVKSSP